MLVFTLPISVILLNSHFNIIYIQPIFSWSPAELWMAYIGSRLIHSFYHNGGYFAAMAFSIMEFYHSFTLRHFVRLTKNVLKVKVKSRFLSSNRTTGSIGLGGNWPLGPFDEFNLKDYRPIQFIRCFYTFTRLFN